MLTDSERAWLKRRQFFNGFYSSGCFTCSLNRTFCEKTDCPLHPDLEDALEFSERVAAKLADTFFFELAPDDVRMMFARLEVEEEMNAESKDIGR